MTVADATLGTPRRSAAREFVDAVSTIMVKELRSRMRGRRAFILLTVYLGLLALIAYSFAPLSYSGAIREVSVVIGAVLGWIFLEEPMGGTRVIGSTAVMAPRYDPSVCGHPSVCSARGAPQTLE